MASIGKGFGGALAGGVAGAAAWGVLTYFTGYEVGFVAWGIGALVGVGMYAMSKGVGGAGAGVLAALVALAAVLGGKLTVAHLMARDFVHEQTHAEVSDEDAIAYLSGEEAERVEADGGDPWTADGEAYTVGVTNAAKSRWRAMSALDQAHFKDRMKSEAQEHASAATGIVTVIAFLTSFGMYDFIWLGLSVSTAYRIGAQVSAGNAVNGAATVSGAAWEHSGEAIGPVEKPVKPAKAGAEGPKATPPEGAAFWGRGDAARASAESNGSMAPMCKPMTAQGDDRRAA